MSDFITFAIYAILIGIAFLVLRSLGYLGLPTKKGVDEPLFAENNVCEFVTGQRRKIEKHFVVNGQDFWKFKGIKFPLALVFNVDIWCVSPFSDKGKRLYKCSLGLDGMKPEYVGERMRSGNFRELKERERTEDALSENKRKPNTSFERTVSEAMDEDYAENVFMERVKIAEAQRPKTKVVKQKNKKVEEVKKE